MHICLIGAGVIGVATAWELAQHGHAVTLLEAREGVGLETSYANAGQLSYSYVAPLADPSVLPQLPKWLLNPNSPLHFQPRLDPQQWRWALAFLCACRGATAQRTAAQLLTLSYLSRDALAQWMARAPLAFDWREAGKLVVYRDPVQWNKARRAVARQAQHGAREHVLDAHACLRLEPALAGFGAQLAGGVYAPDAAVGDCHKFCQALAASLQTLPDVTVRPGSRVIALERVQGRIVAARLASGERVAAQHFVLGNALGARQLLRALGDDAPIYGLKGYSLSLPVPQDPALAPRLSVTDYERRIVYARIGGSLRIAAMVDIGNVSAAPTLKRIALLKRQVAEVFPNLPLQHAQPWAGLRPSTPDGRPRIGRCRAASNLWLNVGHGALGFTLACGSAVLLRHLIEGGAPPINPAPFQP